MSIYVNVQRANVWKIERFWHFESLYWTFKPSLNFLNFYERFLVVLPMCVALGPYRPYTHTAMIILILWNVALYAVCNISLLHLSPEKEKKTPLLWSSYEKSSCRFEKKPISRQFFLHFYITGVDLSMLVAILTMKNLKLFHKRNEWRNPWTYTKEARKFHSPHPTCSTKKMATFCLICCRKGFW